MAEKRMFSKQIVDTDAFLEMPASSQLLYFHLAMRADDEGFVGSPKKIMKMCGFGDDDLKVLIAKRFILTFESGVVVIKHWLIHNTIRMDRFSPTSYQKEKEQLAICKNKAYTEQKESLATIWQPSGNHLATQVKLSKDKIERFANANHPSKKDLKHFRDVRRIESGRPPMTPRKQTDKQKAVNEAFLTGINYFKEKGYADHGMQFMEVQNEKRNAAVRKLVITAQSVLGDLKPLIDWWFSGQGEWAQYEPENCFSAKTIERFKNSKKTKKQGTW